MRIAIFTLLSLTSVGGLIVFAHPNAPSESSPKTRDLLAIGQSHIIHFQRTPHEFRGETPGFRIEQSGEQIPTLIPTTLEVFTAIKKSGDSWVLLEHPKLGDDFSAWDFAKQLESAQKNPASKHILSAELLKRHADELKRIETTQTWVNINHAVTIKALGNETWLLKEIAAANQE